MEKTIVGIAIGLLTFGGIFWFARPDAQSTTSAATASEGVLVVEGENNYDFGSISMAAGKVVHTFTVKNTGSETVVVNKLYTSCMCTIATLKVSGKQLGPFGMAGHGIIPRIDQEMAPGTAAEVEVVFDPSAHGPAGVGRIERAVAIEHNAGKPLELLFAAVVTP